MKTPQDKKEEILKGLDNLHISPLTTKEYFTLSLEEYRKSVEEEVEKKEKAKFVKYLYEIRGMFKPGELRDPMAPLEPHELYKYNLLCAIISNFCSEYGVDHRDIEAEMSRKITLK